MSSDKRCEGGGGADGGADEQGGVYELNTAEISSKYIKKQIKKPILLAQTTPASFGPFS